MSIRQSILDFCAFRCGTTVLFLQDLARVFVIRMGGLPILRAWLYRARLRSGLIDDNVVTHKPASLCGSHSVKGVERSSEHSIRNEATGDTRRCEAPLSYMHVCTYACTLHCISCQAPHYTRPEISIWRLPMFRSARVTHCMRMWQDSYQYIPYISAFVLLFGRGITHPNVNSFSMSIIHACASSPQRRSQPGPKRPNIQRVMENKLPRVPGPYIAQILGGCPVLFRTAHCR